MNIYSKIVRSILIMCLAPLAAVGEPKGAQESRLSDIFDVIWQYQLDSFPEMATFYGYASDNPGWTDLSPQAGKANITAWQEQLDALQQVDAASLSPQALLQRNLIITQLQDNLELAHFEGPFAGSKPVLRPFWPISQLDGWHLTVPQVVAQMPNGTVAELEVILERLRRVPQLFDQVERQLRDSMAADYLPPQAILAGVPKQLASLIDTPLDQHPLFTPFSQLPEGLDAASKARLRGAARSTIEDAVIPAYAKLKAFVEGDYWARATNTVGLSALHNGSEWYAALARQYTTTELTPEQIHQLGLQEVARIKQAMLAIMEQTGFKGDLADFFEFLRSDTQFYFDRPEQLMAAYRDIAKRADPELIKLFKTLPRLPYGVIPVPAYAEQSTTTAYYETGSLATGRAGYFYANTYNLPSRPSWEMEALTLHEAVPGHHLQIAIAQELPETHDLIKNQFFTAFIEGWGLYAESLGEEMGFYQDPYAKFGQLTYEMWRAVRLVVDTGMHAFGWSRQEAIDFFKANAGKTEHDIAVEIDRYIAMPGQALAYKIGELTLKKLRLKAKEALGEQFDVREFHDQILNQGALPMAVLEEKIDAWIASQQ